METGVREQNSGRRSPGFILKVLIKKNKKTKKTSRCPETLYINAKVDFFFKYSIFFTACFFPPLFCFYSM